MEFEFEKIYIDKNVYSSKVWTERANKVKKRFNKAAVKTVDSHWKIPELYNFDPSKWIEAKRKVLVLGIKKGMQMQCSGRSTDFIPPSHANGCLSSCMYCYTARRKGGSNPLTLFLNVEDIADSIEKHSNKLGPKNPNQCDPKYWTYDIGNNNDCSIDLELSNTIPYLIERAKQTKMAKLSFATKTVNKKWEKIDPGDRVRIRYSLMPESLARQIDIRTSRIDERINHINTLVDCGYEVHINFSPVVVTPNSKVIWNDLLKKIDKTLSSKAKQQLKCEVIFLTHSEKLHNLNKDWNPKGESLIWSPERQQTKFNKPDVLCYKYDLKKQYVEAFKRMIHREIPYCGIRYIF